MVLYDHLELGQANTKGGKVGGGINALNGISIFFKSTNTVLYYYVQDCKCQSSFIQYWIQNKSRGETLTKIEKAAKEN